MLSDVVTFESFIHISFSRVCRLLSTLSDFLLEVIEAGDQMNRTVTFNKMMDLSEFEHCSKHVG